MAKRDARTESLTIRLDAKTRFALDFVSRLKGQTVTAVVERALIDAASGDGGRLPDGRNWRDLWNPSQATRELALAAETALYPGLEEDEKLRFVQRHRMFFLVGNEGISVRDEYADVLWPRLSEWMALERENSATDVNACRAAMARALSAAGVTASFISEQGA